MPSPPCCRETPCQVSEQVRGQGLACVAATHDAPRVLRNSGQGDTGLWGTNPQYESIGT